MRHLVLLVLAFASVVLTVGGHRPVVVAQEAFIVIVSLDSATNERLSGACYIINNASIEGCDENGDGQVDFQDVPAGTYSVTETRAPAGYAPVADFIIEVPQDGLHEELVSHEQLGGDSTADQLSSEEASRLFAFYESPTFGYILNWRTDQWRVTEELSEDSRDRLTLVGDAGMVSFDGYVGFSGDPSQCLATAVEQLYAAGEGRELQAAKDEDGNLIEGSFGEARAYALYTFVTTDVEGAERDFVAHLECRRLKSGSAVLQVIYLTTVDQYNENSLGNDPADDLMRSVVMPRASADDARELDRSTTSNCLDSLPRPPAVLLDQSGNEVGLASVVRVHRDDDTTGYFVFVSFENSGDRALPVSPTDLLWLRDEWLLEEESQVTASDTPDEFEWILGEGEPFDRERILLPGQRAVLRLAFAAPPLAGAAARNVFVYAPVTGQETEIGYAAPCFGGPGGRPRLSGS